MEINTHCFVVTIGANYDAVWSERVGQKIKEAETGAVFLVRSKRFKELFLTLAKHLNRSDIKAVVRKR